MLRGILRLGVSVTPKASYATFNNKKVFRRDSGLNPSQPRTPTVSGAELELRQYVESARDLTNIDSFRQTLLKQYKSQQLNENTFDAVFMRGCLAYRNYSLGKAYLKQIESQGRKINTATLSKFLALCYFCQDQIGNRAEIEQWCKVLQSHSEYLDKDSRVNLALALSTTDKWQETVKMLNEDEEINVTVVLNAIVERYLRCDNFVDSLFWMEKLVSKELAVSESVYSYWIQKSATNQHAWDLFMNFLTQNTIFLKQPLIERLKEMVETRDQDAFQGQLTVVDRFTSKCRSCGKPLQNIAISEEDFALLKEAVMKNIVHKGDVFIGSVPEELEKFRSFIQKTAPYDVVIDGLNVAFQSPGKHSNSSDKKMEGVLSVVRHFSKTGKKILVLTRRHALNCSQRLVKELKSQSLVFTTENLSRDDPFLLYAAVQSRHTKFVSEDLFRDHKYRLGDKRLGSLFRIWQRSAQVQIQSFLPNGTVKLQYPLLYRTVTQRNEDSWHIPYDDGTPRYSYELPNTWLCLRPKK